ncbi:MAG: hypothetical protein V6Z86_06070 [Hyphomicrobiales bacterium]
MELRKRLQQAIDKEIAAVLPQAADALWDGGGAVVVIEQMRFTPLGGAQGGWVYCAAFTGRLRLDLIGDTLDDLPSEPLITRLIERPLGLTPDAAAKTGALSHKARATLVERRDEVTATQAVSTLVFDLSGAFLRRDPAPKRPALMVGGHPKTGRDRDDYERIGGGARR